MKRWLVLLLLAVGVLAQSPSSPGTAEFARGVAIPASGTVFIVTKNVNTAKAQPMTYAVVRINPHVGANFAKQELTFMMAKPKGSFDIHGAKAQLRVRDAAPAIFVFYPRREEEERVAALAATWSILHAIPDGDRRVVAAYSYPRMGGATTSEYKKIDCKAERMNDDWVKITPAAPLEPGEYVAAFVPERKDLFADVVYDFAVEKD